MGDSSFDGRAETLVRHSDAGQIVSWANQLNDTLLELASVWCDTQVCFPTLRRDTQQALQEGDRAYGMTVRVLVSRLSVEGRRDILIAHQLDVSDGRMFHHVLRGAIAGTTTGLLSRAVITGNRDLYLDEEILALQERLLEPYQQVYELVEAARTTPAIIGHVLGFCGSWEGTISELVESARLLSQ